MPIKGNKGKGFDLDCIAQNFQVTIATCCGLVFQGTIEDDDNKRAQYGCPVVFPAMTMDFDKEDDKKEDKKEHCPKPQPVEVDVDVKCDNGPKYICLRLTCDPGLLCCPLDAANLTSNITPIRGTGTPGTTLSLFAAGDSVLISIDEIVAIGPSTGGCLALTV